MATIRLTSRRQNTNIKNRSNTGVYLLMYKHNKSCSLMNVLLDIKTGEQRYLQRFAKVKRKFLIKLSSTEYVSKAFNMQ